MTLLRRIFFYLFLAFYFTITPFVILYALGIIYRPHAEDGNRILKTGLIDIDTVPSGAAVYLENRRFHQKAPTVIRDLIPGNYSVRLEFPGYRNWTRSILVQAEKAAVFDHVLLLPEVMTPVMLLANPFRKIIAVENTRFFILARSEAAKDYVVYDWQEKTSRPLFSEPLPDNDAEVEEIFWQPESSVIVAAIVWPDRSRRYFWMDIAHPDAYKQEITALIRNNPKKIYWSHRQVEKLFALNGTSLDKIEVGEMALQPDFAKGVKAACLYGESVYYLSGGDKLLQKGFESKKAQVLVEDEDTLAMLFGDSQTLGMEFLSQDLLLFTNEQGGLLANRLPYQFVKSGVRGCQANSKKSKVVVWQKERIGILDFERTGKASSLFEMGPRIRWLPVRGQNVQHVSWAFEDSHLIALDENQLSLLALEAEGPVRRTELFKVFQNSDVHYDDKEGLVYFLQPGNGELASFQLIPKQELFSLAREEQKDTVAKESQHGI